MKALQRVAEEFESWGNRTSFLPKSRDLFILYLAFFFAPLLISQQSRGRSLPVSAFHARSDGMHTMITAHSGCEGRPDNSLEYVQYALHCGADALEVDVHPKDDGFYISHDPSDGAHPDLKDVFSLIRGSGVKVNCDLKHPGIEHAVLTLAQACGVDEQLIFSGSVSLEAIQDPAIRCRTFWNIESAMPALYAQCEAGIPLTEEQIRAAISLYRRCGVQIVNLYYGLCTQERIALLRENGILTSVWTVNDASCARQFLDAGVYNITTRQPVMVCGLRKETGV